MKAGFLKAWELALILALVFCLVGIAYGEMLSQTERAQGKRTDLVTLSDQVNNPTLTDLGLTKRESAEAQILASISIAKGRMSWMKDNLVFSDRTATQYMQAYARKDFLKSEAASVLETGWWRALEHKPKPKQGIEGRS